MLHSDAMGHAGGGTGCAGARVPRAQTVSAAPAMRGSTLKTSEPQVQGGERQESAFLASTPDLRAVGRGTTFESCCSSSSYSISGS